MQNMGLYFESTLHDKQLQYDIYTARTAESTKQIIASDHTTLSVKTKQVKRAGGKKERLTFHITTIMRIHFSNQ